MRYSGEDFKKLRIESGLSRKEVEELTGIKEGTLYYIENNASTIKKKNYDLLYDLLGEDKEVQKDINEQVDEAIVLLSELRTLLKESETIIEEQKNELTRLYEVEDEYENILRIINLARTEVLDVQPKKSKFRMDSNGNLERMD